MEFLTYGFVWKQALEGLQQHASAAIAIGGGSITVPWRLTHRHYHEGTWVDPPHLLLPISLETLREDEQEGKHVTK